MTRNRIVLLAVLCLALVALAYQFVRPAILSERAIRVSLSEHLREWTGATVSIGGPARLSYFPRLQVELDGVRISGIKRLPPLREVRARSLEVRLGLWSLISGTPVIDRVTLIEPQIDSGTKPLDGQEAAPGDQPALIRVLTTAPFDQIAIENGVVNVTGPEKSEQFTGVGVKLNLRRSGGSHSSRGSFTWRGQNVTYRHEGGAPRQVANAVEIPVKITIGGNLFTAGIDGKANVAGGLSVAGKLDLKIPNLPGFARWTGVMVPADRKSGDFSASGAFHWAGHRIGFDEGSFDLDGNRALGAMALEFGGPRPQIEGTLALQRLDLTQYFLPAAAPAVPPPDGKPAQPVTLDVDFPMMHHLNVDLRLSTNEITAAPFSVGQSALSLSLDAGRLTADIAIFKLCGGNGSARLEFDATVPDSAFRVTAGMSGISARGCIEIFTPKSPLEGATDVTADVTSKGRTLLELLGGLVGKASISMNAGLANVDFQRLLSALRTGPVNGWGAIGGNTTEFQSLKGNVFFRNGGAYTDSLKIALGKLNLNVEGTMSLAGGELDMRMLMTNPPPAAESRQKKKVPVKQAGAIVIKGPWSEPRFTLEPAKSHARVSAPGAGSLTASHGGR